MNSSSWSRIEKASRKCQNEYVRLKEKSNNLQRESRYVFEYHQRVFPFVSESKSYQAHQSSIQLPFQRVNALLFSNAQTVIWTSRGEKNGEKEAGVFLLIPIKIFINTTAKHIQQPSSLCSVCCKELWPDEKRRLRVANNVPIDLDDLPWICRQYGVEPCKIGQCYVACATLQKLTATFISWYEKKKNNH